MVTMLMTMMIAMMIMMIMMMIHDHVIDDDDDDDDDDDHDHDHDHMMIAWWSGWTTCIPCTGSRAQASPAIHQRAKIPCTGEAVNINLGNDTPLLNLLRSY